MEFGFVRRARLQISVKRHGAYFTQRVLSNDHTNALYIESHSVTIKPLSSRASNRFLQTPSHGPPPPHPPPPPLRNQRPIVVRTVHASPPHSLQNPPNQLPGSPLPSAPSSKQASHSSGNTNSRSSNPPPQPPSSPARSKPSSAPPSPHTPS